MKTEVFYTRQITKAQLLNIRKLCQDSEKKADDAICLARRYRALARAALKPLDLPMGHSAIPKRVEMSARLARLDAQAGFGRTQKGITASPQRLKRTAVCRKCRGTREVLEIPGGTRPCPDCDERARKQFEDIGLEIGRTRKGRKG